MPHRRPRHGDKSQQQPKSASHGEHNDKDAKKQQEPVAPAARQPPRPNPYEWSIPWLDPSGMFYYRARLRPDGEWEYHFEGLQSYGYAEAGVRRRSQAHVSAASYPQYGAAVSDPAYAAQMAGMYAKQPGNQFGGYAGGGGFAPADGQAQRGQLVPASGMQRPSGPPPQPAIQFKIPDWNGHGHGHGHGHGGMEPKNKVTSWLAEGE